MSILLVEDHAIFAVVLIRLLRQRANLEVTMVAKNAESALQHMLKHKFDLALVDVSLPVMNGINLVSLIHLQYPKLPCLMLSGHMLPHYVHRALEAGARGYVLKDNPDDILEGIQHVMRGETYVCEALRNV